MEQHEQGTANPGTTTDVAATLDEGAERWTAERPIAAGEILGRLAGLDGLAAPAGPDPATVTRRLGAHHACWPSCRLTHEGLLVAMTPLAVGAPLTVDLDDLLWLPADPAATPRCNCGHAACRGAASGFATLPADEQQHRLATGRALPHLAAREARTRSCDQQFLGEDYAGADYAAARVVVLSAPYEGTVSYGHGTAAGPAALIEASANVELFDEETFRALGADVHTLATPVLPPDPGATVAVLRAAAHQPLADGKLLLTLGGEHSISAGPIAAAAQLFPGLGVLHLDAHLDLRNSYGDTPHSHASVMRRVVDDLGLPVVAVGIRSFSAEEAELVQQRGYQPLYAHALDPAGDWISEVLARLPQHVYLSFDLDALDPAEFPGTGTPEPGGMHYRQALALLRAVISSRRLVAADLVELAPLPGSHVSEFLAARIAEKIVAYTAAFGLATQG